MLLGCSKSPEQPKRGSHAGFLFICSLLRKGRRQEEPTQSHVEPKNVFVLRHSIRSLARLTRAAKPISFVNERIDLCDLRTATTPPQTFDNRQYKCNRVAN